MVFYHSNPTGLRQEPRRECKSRSSPGRWRSGVGSPGHWTSSSISLGLSCEMGIKESALHGAMMLRHGAGAWLRGGPRTISAQHPSAKKKVQEEKRIWFYLLWCCKEGHQLSDMPPIGRWVPYPLPGVRAGSVEPHNGTAFSIKEVKHRQMLPVDEP